MRSQNRSREPPGAKKRSKQRGVGGDAGGGSHRKHHRCPRNADADFSQWRAGSGLRAGGWNGLLLAAPLRILYFVGLCVLAISRRVRLRLSSRGLPRLDFRAGDGSRTHDLQLGKLSLYQLSYARLWCRLATARHYPQETESVGGPPKRANRQRLPNTGSGLPCTDPQQGHRCRRPDRGATRSAGHQAR